MAGPRARPRDPEREGLAACIRMNKEITAAATAAEVLAIHRLRGAGFNAISYASAMHRVAGLAGCGGCGAEAWALEPGLLARLPEFGPRELSSTAWSMAKLRWPDGPLLAAIAAEALGKISAFEPQNLTNTSWALAGRRVIDTPLLTAISA